jgi:hypothetical protein
MILTEMPPTDKREEEPPLALGFLLKPSPYPGECYIRVCCPLCGRAHSHGWRLQHGPSEPQPKRSHCGRGLYLVAPYPPEHRLYASHYTKPGKSR